MSCNTEYLKKQLLIFFGNVVSVVLYCVQTFWWLSHKPSEKIWAISPKTNTKIPKRRSVRSKFVFLNAALLFSLVVTNENCFKNLLRSLYLEQYGFFDQMQTHISAGLVLMAKFGTFALYILRLRCLGISNSNKNSFCFLRKTEIFQKDVEYVPERSFWALLGLILWL